MVGNIYKGKVENVLAGMDAAFVDVGLQRNGFLYVDEVTVPEESDARPKKITQLLKPGQEIVVQVIKDPMRSKGSRLTTQLSLAGRYLVYVPGGSLCGVSRRLPDDERQRLRKLCRELKPDNAGIIVRTAAEGVSENAITRDVRFLEKLWSMVQRRLEQQDALSLVLLRGRVGRQSGPRSLQRGVHAGAGRRRGAREAHRQLPAGDDARVGRPCAALPGHQAALRDVRHRSRDPQGARAAGRTARRGATWSSTTPRP